MIPIISIVVAIGIPAFAIWKNGKKPLKRPYLFSVISFTFCTIAAIMELFTINFTHPLQVQIADSRNEAHFAKAAARFVVG